MRLVTVALENIRSYRSARIDFQEGTTLLSGDIGSGKSTLLLAIEFALFGLARGELTGEALLRHGAENGTVTVTFSAGEDYVVSRSLKRTRNGIVQDTCWLELNGQRAALTATELKARIFEILGYPLQFLGKKNLLYRFTLYTPQEEMKSILMQSDRIETIRRLFGIDAYRTMRDNAQLLGKELKQRVATNEMLLERLANERELLQQKLQDERELETQQTTLENEKNVLNERRKKTETNLTQTERKLTALQTERQVLAMQIRNKALLENEISRLDTQRKEKETRLAEARAAVASMKAKFQDAEPGEPLQEQLLSLRRELADALQEQGKIDGIVEQTTLPALEAGTTCPTCQQTVSEQHVHVLMESVGAKKEAAERKRAKLDERKVRIQATIEEVTKRLDLAKEQAELRQRHAMQERSVRDQEQDVANVQSVLDEKGTELAQLPHVEQRVALEERWNALEETVEELRHGLTELRQQLLEVEKRLAVLMEQRQVIAALKEERQRLDEEIAAHKKKREHDAKYLTWLAEQFTPFTTVVERHVLVAIHSTFDAAFRTWFTKLVDDDALSARLDHEFSPVLEQHGYETTIAHLSGGERTAVALAYRLALVHTIHALLPHLGTAGLIMLDEPTDGFSSEQLARMQDVLRDLRMEQVIIVSHEEQLESFVDHVIRVEKAEESTILL